MNDEFVTDDVIEQPDITPAILETIQVKVARLPGRVYNVALNGGRTVRDAFYGAELDDSGEIRVNGSPADLDQELVNGDVVTAIKKISGNI